MEKTSSLITEHSGIPKGVGQQIKTLHLCQEGLGLGVAKYGKLFD